MKQRAQTIDMTIDGRFVEPPKPSLATIAARVLAFGVLLGLVAIGFWFTLFIIPILVVAGIGVYLILALIG